METLLGYFVENPNDWIDKIIEYGNLASIIGLVVALIGFGITIYNTRKSKTAAQQAEQAVNKMREDIRQVDTIGELTSAITRMDEIKRLHRKKAWDMLPDRYSELKKLLISIKSANPNLTDIQKITLQNSLTHFSTIDEEIDRCVIWEQQPKDVPRLNKIVSMQVDKLAEILEELRGEVGG